MGVCGLKLIIEFIEPNILVAKIQQILYKDTHLSTHLLTKHSPSNSFFTLRQAKTSYHKLNAALKRVCRVEAINDEWIKSDSILAAIIDIIHAKSVTKHESIAKHALEHTCKQRKSTSFTLSA